MLSNNANLLYGILTSAGVQSVSGLVQRTGLSQPVISRALAELAQYSDRLVTHRQGRQIWYALLRPLRELPIRIPVYSIAATPDVVSAQPLGTLSALEGGKYLFAAQGKSELLDGLPWFMQDMRPQGYVGRAFCHAHAGRLGLPEQLNAWSEDEVLYALARLGSDVSGNLLLGDAALQGLLAAAAALPAPDDLASEYDQLAQAAVQGGVPGSLAAGEHPKFLARYSMQGEVRHLIVKFSPLLDGSPAATRWRDLLIAEHLASCVLGEHGVAVPHTQIVMSAQRCYLASTRFDRVGLHGRIPTVSLDAIDHDFIGSQRNWTHSAAQLRRQKMLGADDESRIQLLAEFGRGIANTDMHLGNLSLYWAMQDGQIKLSLAPIYDMLPMLYAPEKSELVQRNFKPPEVDVNHPVAATARRLAHDFWLRVAAHGDVSSAFRQLARDNAARLYTSVTGE